ncbi:MAG: phage portal protein [Desulfovibrio sp.]|nr:phage portal protein [Desulfovibrio sp.]
MAGQNLSAWRAEAQERDTDIWQGVEYDIYTGESVGYHFQTSYAWQQVSSWREPAENVLHGFQMLRPGQLRGVPCLPRKSRHPYVQGGQTSLRPFSR